MNKNDAKRKAAKAVNPKLDKLGRELGLTLLDRVMKRTPVDTGNARGNWNASEDYPDHKVWDRGKSDPAGFGENDADALRRGSIVIGDWEMSKGTPLYVSNAVPYIVPLEEGHSKQSPAGWVRLTVVEMKAVAEAEARMIGREPGNG